MVYKIVTKGLNISGWLGILAVLVLIVLGWWFFSGGPEGFTSPVTTDQSRPALSQPVLIRPDPAFVDETLPEFTQPGTFNNYDEQSIAALPEASRIILFFTTVRCSACQQAEISIASNQAAIPSDVHIFFVDHTTSPELRRQYEVTVPHTFVEITIDGEFVQSWRASRDLQSILARL